MKVLVISVHPDDETLGCGGTILKHREAGDSIYWLIVTQPYEPRTAASLVERKALEVERVTEAYGVKQCVKLGLPPAELDAQPYGELIEKIREVFSNIRPELVYLVHVGDAHTDHQVVFNATLAVLKPIYMGDLGVRRVLSYETLSSTEAAAPGIARPFVPNILSDITPHIDRKIEIMNLYETEVHPDPLPRGPSAIRGLARYRGATRGVEYAEAFMLVRELI